MSDAEFPENGPRNKDKDSTLESSFLSSDLTAGLAAAFGSERGTVSSGHLHSSLYESGAIIANRYRLIERIGEGGMGFVWYAEQLEPVKRKVAIKLIKPGLDSRSVLGRFEAERQALAMMDHPNIARVFDGGISETGHPFFVMELVRGTSITRWCDENKVDLRGRLELLIPVCQAIHHAHQKGIIHRDIKPSNVMVAMFDGKPVPKVIDFGVAKAFGTSLTEDSLHTAFGAVVGTAEYMSPEQAELNNLDIDTRSDVYSLGVLMYELLAGSPPFSRAEMADRGWHEVLRLIREVDPQLPSAKLSTSKMRASIATLRGTEPAALGRLLRSELDWIVMKSLEKERSRRYESASAMAGDLQRYLVDEPVEACPPSTVYRFRKFARRYRWQALAGGLLLASLIAGIIGTSWGLIRAESQRKFAEQARKDADERAEGERIAKLEAQRQQRLAEDAEDATLESYRASTDDAIQKLIGSKPVLGLHERTYLENALKRWKEFADRKGDDERSRSFRAEAHRRAALIWESLGQSVDARFEYESAAAILVQLVADFSTNPSYRYREATCKRDFGVLLSSMGETSLATDHLRQAEVTLASLVDECPSIVEYRSSLARSRENLGHAQRFKGKFRDAERSFQQALEIREKLVAEFPDERKFRDDLATNQVDFAGILRQLGDFSQAEDCYRAALNAFQKLAKEYPDYHLYRHQLAACQRELSKLLQQLERLDEVEEFLQAGTAVLESLVTELPSFPRYQKDLASIKLALAMFLFESNRNAEGELQVRDSNEIMKRLVAKFPTITDYRSDMATNNYNLGLHLRKLDRLSDVEEPYRRAIAIDEELVREFPLEPGYRSSLASSQNSLAILFDDLGRTTEAEAEYLKALAIREKLVFDFPSVPRYAVELGGSYCNLGQLLRNNSKVTESLVWFAKAIATLTPIDNAGADPQRARKYLRNSHWGRAKSQQLLGQFSAADWDRAIELSLDDDQTSFKIRKLLARFRTGEQTEAVADLDVWLDKIPEDQFSSNEWFDLACLLSFAANHRTDWKDDLVAKAVTTLERAVQSGFADKQRALEDSALDSIRDRPKYAELIEQISGQSEEKQ